MSNVERQMRLDERCALVTGAAGYLGGAICRALAALGARVVMTDRPGSNIQKTLDEIGDVGVFTPADLEKEAEVRALPEIASRFGQGRLDIVVNCAAFVGDSSLPGWAVPFEQQGTEAWRRALEVNLTSAFSLIQSALPHLQRSPNASVVNVGSIYGVVGPDWRMYEGTALGNPAAYAASKGGLVQLTRWLATTVAPKVRVNCVSPGGIQRGHTEPFLSRYLDRVPLRRMGTEADVVGAVMFLAGDLAAYITGQNLMVDGGWTAW